MRKLTVPKDIAEQIVYEDHDDWEKIEETIVDQTRWNTHYEGIFRYIPTNRFYKIGYSKGSTECQDTDLFYKDEVEFYEVELKEVVVKKWMVV